MKFLKSTVLAGALCLGVFSLSSCTSSPEAKSARYIEKGKKLLAKHDAARAVLEFQNAVRATPGSAEPHYQLGMALLAAGDVQKGIGELQQALDIAPTHRNAQKELARLMAITDDKDLLKDAEHRLQDVLQADPNDPDALHSLALTELKLGDSQSAIRDLNHAVSVAPQQVLIAATLAQAKLQQGDFKGAEEVLKNAREKSPNSVTAVVLLGRLYLAQNRFGEAEQQMRAALSMNPQNSNALYNLALVQIRAGQSKDAEDTLRTLSRLPDKTANSALATFLYQNGRKAEAVREFERLSKEDPEDRVARTRLIWAYQAVGREAEAEAVLAAVLHKNPKDLDALLQRGEVYLAHGKFGDAEADLNRVLSLKPASPEVHYVLGRLYKARGEDLRYQQELTKSLELNPMAIAVRLELAKSLTQAKTAQGALDVLNQAPASQKDSVEFLAARNWALWAKGDMAELRKGIDQGLSLDRSTQFLLQDGLWKLRAGDVTGARHSLEEALKIDPTDVLALAALHDSYELQKQTAVAVEKVKEFASHEPKSAPVQSFLGSILLARGDRAGARQAFQAAKTDSPDSIDPDMSLTETDILDGKMDDARGRLQKILSKTPQNPTAHLWLGDVELMRSDFGSAEQQFRAVLALTPDNSQALNNLAYLMSENTSRSAEALKFAQKARELAPDKPEYADTLGWILYQRGLYPSAVQELEHATAVRNRPTWEYHLAMAYAKAGDAKHARALLQTALKQDPNSAEAKLARQVVGDPGSADASSH